MSAFQDDRSTANEWGDWTHLDVREEHLEHVGAWVAGVEKHELGLLQMIGGETFLDLNIAAVKDVNICLKGNNFRYIKQT